MNNQQKNQSVRESVLSAIETGRVKMKPRWKFVLKTLFMLAGTVLLLLAALYVASIIVFLLRENGAWFAPGFGLSGYGVLLRSLPWVLVVVAVLFMVLLQVMVHKYAFAYGRPLFYTVFGVIFLVTVGGIVIGRTTFHQHLLPPESRLPVAGKFYRSLDRLPENLSIGKVEEITKDGCILEDRRYGFLSVFINDDTDLPTDGFDKDDIVAVLGSRSGNLVRADAVRILKELPPPPLYRTRIIFPAPGH